MNAARHRFVLLGASNARMGLPQLLAVARGAVDAPLDFYAAIGHGRSYGQWSSVPGRGLPGILECGAWPALEDSAPRPTAAVVTDIGNDLLYGVAPEQLIDWVTECVDRLLERGAKVVVTELPLVNLARLGPMRYRLVRTLTFPECRIPLHEMVERATSVNEHVVQLGARDGVQVATPRAEWYGLDPIHVKRRQYATAWKKILQSVLNDSERCEPRSLTLAERIAAMSGAAAERRLIGLTRRCAQPCRTLSDGSTLSLY